jgi:hypothetical protein
VYPSLVCAICSPELNYYPQNIWTIDVRSCDVDLKFLFNLFSMNGCLSASGHADMENCPDLKFYVWSIFLGIMIESTLNQWDTYALLELENLLKFGIRLPIWNSWHHKSCQLIAKTLTFMFLEKLHAEGSIWGLQGSFPLVDFRIKICHFGVFHSSLSNSCGNCGEKSEF